MNHMCKSNNNHLRIGIDATALTERSTGVGNYVSALLVPLCRAHPEVNFFFYSNTDIAFESLPNVKKRISAPKRRGPYWQNTHLKTMLLADKPDIFWATNGLMPVIRSKNMATVVTVHDLVYHFASETLPFHSLWGRRICQPMAVRAADKVIAVSAATAADLHVISGRKADAIIHPLADTRFIRPKIEAINAVISKLGLPQQYLLTLGTLEPRKNLVGLVDAYMQQINAGVQLPLLAIAGGKGWLDSDIDQRLTEGEARGVIRRLGYVSNEDLPALYAGCNAFLMPSLYEGFGMPLLEAQLCGAPVIHGPHTSMHEASGGLGVETGTSIDAMASMLANYAAGRLPLACRLAGSVSNNAIESMEKLWVLLVEAVQAKRRAR